MTDAETALLRLEASAEEFTLLRRDGRLWLRRERYVDGAIGEQRVESLDGVLAVLRDTALPFCEVVWLAPESERPPGHAELEERVAVLVDEFRSHAATVRFTV